MTSPLAMYDGKRTISSEVQRIKQSWPKLYGRFFSRIYDYDSHFFDWRLPLYYNCTSIVHAIQNKVIQNKIPENFLIEAQIANAMAKHENPLYFVNKDLLNACLFSSPAKDLDLKSLAMPHPGLSFIFPVGTVKGIEVCFLSVASDPIATDIPLVLECDDAIVEGTVSSADNAVLISTFFPRTFETWTFRVSEEYMNKTDEIDFDEHFRDMRGRIIPNKKFKENGDHISNLLITTALNLLCAMKVKPEIIISERKIKQTKRNKIRSYWSPNVLGRSYRIVTESSIQKGSHASPRTHWRRGHFRNQGVGERVYLCAECTCHRKMHSLEGTYCQSPDCKCTGYRQDKAYRTYKLIWIEPILVNVK